MQHKVADDTVQLTPEKIALLEQNYINSDSAPFVTKVLSIYRKYTSSNNSGIDYLRSDFLDLYNEAENINPAALPYASLTTLVFKDEQDSAEGFISALKEFYIDIFQEKKSDKKLTVKDEKAISVLAKTTEHLSLALSQKNSLYKEQKSELDKLEKGLQSENDDLQELNNNFLDLKESLEDTKNNYIKYKSKYDKMTIDFLSMMGIFSTIIFAIFGGLSQIGAIGDNLAETPLSKILMYISLSAITLILIVFISFNAISKLTGLKLKSCACKNEEECSCTIRQKHPTLSFSLFFFVDLFLFSLVLKVIRYSDWVNSINDIFNLKNDNLIKFIIFTVFLGLNILVFLKLIFPKCKWLSWIKFI
ncbi:hypothetical protein [Enterococcus faecium]|uniref:hypothetical protein n=1 Tax=Enterococcus faecium TaxID=1352 RepID=UPI00187E6C05|nr:hypothetical protein [Enterococcus faecium]EGP4967584.1 hypothetical protein [Enterococcus faecium]MBE8865283.1 hypothetical protein [Enterococcus faecium]MDB7513426.1 hypothetical protein [Enterococcus faecium]